MVGAQRVDRDDRADHGEAQEEQTGGHGGARYRPAPLVTPALEVQELGQALRRHRRAARGRPDRRRGRARRPAGTQRRGQVDARQERRRASCGPRRGTVRVCGAAAGTPPARRALGYLAELFRFPGWASADELLHLHQRLSGSTGGAAERAELLGLVGLGDEARAARRGDVEGHAAAPRDRAGADRRPAPAAARRADERAGPRRAADRARPAGRAAPARRRRAAQHPPAQRGRARVRPRGDHRPRRAAGRGAPGRAVAPARRRGRDAGRHAALRGRHPRRGAGDRRAPGRRRRAHLRGPSRALDARGRLSGRRRSCRARRGPCNGVLVVAAYALRESLRRRVFAVVVVLTLAFGSSCASVSAPADRHDPDWARLVKQTADAVSHTLGYTGPKK